MNEKGFNCTSIYMEHDDKIDCPICPMKMCKKCHLHYFWESNNKDIKNLYCPIHLNQQYGELTLQSFTGVMQK